MRKMRVAFTPLEKKRRAQNLLDLRFSNELQRVLFSERHVRVLAASIMSHFAEVRSTASAAPSAYPSSSSPSSSLVIKPSDS